MGRKGDIEVAFRNSIRHTEKGGRTVETADFVVELAKLNWNWELKEANHWIEIYCNSFKDISTEEGERRTFVLFNPNNRY